MLIFNNYGFPGFADFRNSGGVVMRRIQILLAAAVFFLVLSAGSVLATSAKVAILPFDGISQEDISFILKAVPRLLKSRIQALTGEEVLLTEREGLEKLAPDYVVTGTVTKLGGAYSVDVVVSDSSGKKVAGSFVTAKDENGIISGLDSLAADLVGKIPAFAVRAPAKAEYAKEERPAGAAALPLPGREISSASPAAAEGKTEDEFRSIKRLKILGELPGEIIRVAAGEADGDGKVEVAFSSVNRLFIYRFDGEELRRIYFMDREKGAEILNLNFFDLEGDGKEELIVTEKSGDFLQSFILAWRDGRFRVIAKKLPYYFNVLDDFRGKRVLAGQRMGFGTAYVDRAHVLSWNGSGFEEKEKIKMPESGEFTAGIINVNALRFKGEQRLVWLDEYEKLKVFDLNGKLLFKSKEAYSGALLSFIIPSEPLKLEGHTNFYVKGRVVKVGEKQGLPLLLVRFAPEPALIKSVRKFDWSKLEVLEWDGISFVEKASSEKVSDLMTDFAVMDVGEKKYIVAPVVETTTFGTVAETSKLLLFILE